MNEVLQWVGLIVLLVLILGLFRQVSVMQPASDRAARNGPEVGSRLPNRLLSAINENQRRQQGSSEELLVFVSENCIGCQRLIATMSDTGSGIDNRKVVVVARQPSPSFVSALNETGLRVVVDEDGSIWSASGVTATPLVVEVNGQGTVLRKEVTSRVDELLKTG